MNNTLSRKASLLAKKLNYCIPKLQSEVGESVSGSTGGHEWNDPIPKNSGLNIRVLILNSSVPEDLELWSPYYVGELPGTNTSVWFVRSQEHYGALCTMNGKKNQLFPYCRVIFCAGRICQIIDSARRES